MLFLLGQFYPADFTWDEDILCLHGHNLVGELVDADERGMYSPLRPFSSTTRPMLPVSSRFFLSSSEKM